uniref:Uncharacterized protein n=1 Tax=Arundo donax TaxID=35708 RepID=A0A0A8ZUU9_ARUDO
MEYKTVYRPSVSEKATKAQLELTCNAPR